MCVCSGGGGGGCDFGRPVNPISKRGGRLCPLIHYSRFIFWILKNFLGPNVRWLFVLSYDIWNHASWQRSVLNMTHFQLFAWFGQTQIVRKMGGNSKLFILDTFGSKTNFQWLGWFWTMCSYQIFKCNYLGAKFLEGKKCPEKVTFSK